MANALPWIGHALLIVLKVLGITLLSVLALVLLILCLVLFVPIRYRVQGRGHVPQYNAQVRVTWLLHLVNVGAEYDSESKLSWGVKVLGIRILPKKAAEISVKADEPVKVEAEHPTAEKPAEEKVESAEPVPEPEAEDMEPESPEDTQKPPQKESFRRKGRRIILQTEEKIRTTAGAIKTKIEGVKAKADEYIGMATDEDNQKAALLIKDKLIGLLVAYRPRRLKGYLILGLEDPSTTGKILGAYYALYPFNRNDFSLTGVFDEQIIEGDAVVTGRIALYRLAAALIALIANKTIRSWIRK